MRRIVQVRTPTSEHGIIVTHSSNYDMKAYGAAQERHDGTQTLSYSGDSTAVNLQRGIPV